MKSDCSFSLIWQLAICTSRYVHSFSLSFFLFLFVFLFLPFCLSSINFVKDYRLAERCCTRALEIDPSSVKGFYRRARARDGLGNVAGALKDVQRALAFDLSDDESTSLKQLQENLQDKVRKREMNE
jgi:tetratricopeptide (TPR) repeat protein